MNKKVIVVSILVLVMTFSLAAASKKQEMWRKAITEKNLELKLQYLKEYEAEFGAKKDRFHKFLYLNLADTAFQLTKYDESIQYGEKALTYEDVDDASRLRVYLALANAYKVTQKDMEKAYHYAGKTIEIVKALIEQQEKSTQAQEKRDTFINNYKAFYLAPSLRIQVQVLYGKGKDNPETLKEAALKAVEAFNVDKSKRSSELVSSLAVNLYKKKLTNDAINALESVLNKEKPEYKHSYLLGNLYNRKKDKDKAAYYFEMAYRTDHKARLAMNIGKLVYKKNINKGIKFFAEAFVLLKSNKESDAYRFLEQLYFNGVAKNLSAEEQEKGFKEIINSARSRLGMKPITPAAPAATEGSAEG